MKKLVIGGIVLCFAVAVCSYAMGMGSKTDKSEMKDKPTEMKDKPTEMKDKPTEMKDKPTEMKDKPTEMKLEGKCYTGTVVSKKDAKTYEENIIFENGMIRSTACEGMGFKPGKCTVTEKDGMTMVKGSIMNDKGDMNEIDAKIKGDAMTGTITSKKADGSKDEPMALTAKLKEMPKTEEKKAMEHPSSEHPK